MMYDTIIIGGGPSGLSAAIAASSEGLQVAVLEKGKLGGAIVASNRIENYPCGLGTELTGSEFAYHAEQQSRQFGVAFFTGPQYRVVEIKKYGGFYRVFTDSKIFASKTVILAIGTAHRQLDINGLEGPNVIYDGEIREVLYRSQPVLVLGGGNSAGQAAEALDAGGARVLMITHRPIEASMSAYLVGRIRSKHIEAVVGEVVSAAKMLDGTFDVVLAGGDTWAGLSVVYVFAGSQPNTVWLDDLVERDTDGYITNTKVAGLWAVGDVRTNAVRRLSCAVGSGSEVIPALYAYLKGASDV